MYLFECLIECCFVYRAEFEFYFIIQRLYFVEVILLYMNAMQSDIVSCNVVSCYIVSCDIVSSDIVSCDIFSSDIVSGDIVS